MPIVPTIDKDNRRVVVVLTEEFSTVDIFRAIDTAVTHPDFEPGFNVLADHRGVTRIIESDQVRSTAAHLDKWSSAFAGSRWAAVAGDSALQYGMLRMLSGFVSVVPINMRVFTDENEAIAWLESESDGLRE